MEVGFTWGYILSVTKFLGSVTLSIAALSGVVYLIGRGLVAFNDWLGLFLLLRKKRGEIRGRQGMGGRWR